MINTEKLLAFIDYQREKSGITKKEIAKKLDVSESTVTNLFKHRHKIKYMTFIELTRIVYGRYHHEYIRYFCMDSQLDIEREALEWAYSNSDMQVLKILINKASIKADIDPIVRVYELQMKRLEKSISEQDFFEGVEEVFYTNKNLDLETLVLIGISTIYHLVDVAAYSAVAAKSQNTLKQINNVQSSYLKNAYSLRIKITLTVASMRSKQLDVAKELSEELAQQHVLEMFPLFYNNALICLSEIYVFTNKEKSFKYINQSVQLMNDGFIDENPRWKAVVKSTYDFVHIYHNDFQDLFFEEPAEKAHYYAKQLHITEREKALKILNEIEAENGGLSNFQSYYKALAMRDLKLMHKVKDKFYQSGDFYYVQLPQDFIENSY